MNLKCPTCRTDVAEKVAGVWPFCSERCKLIDLGKWAAEEYRVPGPEIPEGMTAEEMQEVLQQHSGNGNGKGNS